MWRSKKRKQSKSSLRVRWGKPQNQKDIQKKEKRQQSGTRNALIISLILHLAALLALKDVILHQSGYSISNSIHVALIDPESVEKSPPPIRRTDRPIMRERRAPKDASPRRLSQDRLSERSIKANIIDKDASETDIPTISANISRDRPLPNPISSGTSATGASTRAQGKSDRSASGYGKRGMEGLASVSTRARPTDGVSISGDFEIYPEADLPFIKALEEIAQHVVNVKKSQKVDIVFIIDTSESMQNDIDAVRRHLNRMIDRLELAGLDFTLGVVRFHHSLVYEWLGMDITISPQTSNPEEIREILRSIKVSGGERALDALMKAISKVKFRPGADRHFILVTDEYVHGTYPVQEVLKAVKRAGITIDVLGRNEVFQRTIAEQTGGIWTPIYRVGNK